MPSTSNWKNGIFLKVCHYIFMLIFGLSRAVLPPRISQFTAPSSVFTATELIQLSLDRKRNRILCFLGIQSLHRCYSGGNLPDWKRDILHTKGIRLWNLVTFLTRHNLLILTIDAWAVKVPCASTSPRCHYLPVLRRRKKGYHRWYRLAFPPSCRAKLNIREPLGV
jgi:hypothetical protein